MSTAMAIVLAMRLGVLPAGALAFTRVSGPRNRRRRRRPGMWCREALEPPGDLLEPALDIEDGIHVPAGVEEANSSRRGEVREADHNQVGEHRAHDVQVRSVGTRRDICWIRDEVCGGGR